MNIDALKTAALSALCLIGTVVVVLSIITVPAVLLPLWACLIAWPVLAVVFFTVVIYVLEVSK